MPFQEKALLIYATFSDPNKNRTYLLILNCLENSVYIYPYCLGKE